MEADIVKVTTNGKMHGVDVKTCYSITEFARNFMKYRYDLQAALYYKGLADNAKTGVLKGYSTDGMYTFIVVDQQCRTMKFTLNSSSLSRALSGGRTWGGKRVKGLDQLLTAYKWNKLTNIWDHTKEQEDNNGEILDIYQ